MVGLAGCFCSFRAKKIKDMLKRLFDIIFSFLGLIIIFPLLIIVAILVKQSSKGPIFYRGERVGKNGKIFRPYKFRTMVTGAEKIGSSTTGKNDPRVTKIGRFLRKYKIDEFPQLIDVLRGRMSLVGPRPELEEHVECYNEEEKRILEVLPGMTDYASVEFVSLDEEVGEEDVDEMYIKKVRGRKNKLRLKYVNNQSFFKDLKILIKTFSAILKK